VRALLLAALLAVAVVALACGDDDDPPATPDAAELASSLLLQVDDLPGAGWNSLGFPEQQDFVAAPFVSLPEPGIAACDELSAQQSPAQAEAASKQSAGALGYYDKAPDASGSQPVVQMAVAIYDTPETAQAALGATRDLVESPLFAECFEESARQGGLAAEDGALQVSAPHGEIPGAVSTTLELTTAEGGVLRQELHYWTDENAAFYLIIAGSQDNPTADDVRTIVDNALARIDDNLP
jgi:hypothetical protein